MRYFFKSDYYRYAHPELAPRPVGSFTEKELLEAIENTKKMKYSRKLLENALEASGGRLPKTQVGTLLLFPELPEGDMEMMEGFIAKEFEKSQRELAGEYSDKSDPTSFWEVGSGGRHFSGKAVNHATKETYGVNSPTLYMAGCKDTTADYLVEIALDRMYGDSSKHDRKKGRKSPPVGFNRFKAFLVYSFGSGRFYEFANHERYLYHKPDRNIPSVRDVPIYEFLNRT